MNDDDKTLLQAAATIFSGWVATTLSNVNELPYDVWRELQMSALETSLQSAFHLAKEVHKRRLAAAPMRATSDQFNIDDVMQSYQRMVLNDGELHWGFAAKEKPGHYDLVIHSPLTQSQQHTLHLWIGLCVPARYHIKVTFA